MDAKQTSLQLFEKAKNINIIKHMNRKMDSLEKGER